MTDKEQSLYILSKCYCTDPKTELKLLTLALRYWEDGSEPDDAISKAAEFLLINDK